MSTLQFRRLTEHPIIHADLCRSIGTNVQGPSLIRVADWLPNPLGKYYRYFADHKGAYIRLAWANDLRGPWQIYSPGTLQLEQSCFLTEPADIPDDMLSRLHDRSFTLPPADGVPSPLASATMPHIASPDVHVRVNQLRDPAIYHEGDDVYLLYAGAGESGIGIAVGAVH